MNLFDTQARPSQAEATNPTHDHSVGAVKNVVPTKAVTTAVVPAGAGSATPPPDEGEELFTINRSDDEQLRGRLKSYKGHPFVSIEKWKKDKSDRWWPQMGSESGRNRELETVGTALLDLCGSSEKEPLGTALTSVNCTHLSSTRAAMPWSVSSAPQGREASEDRNTQIIEHTSTPAKLSGGACGAEHTGPYAHLQVSDPVFIDKIVAYLPYEHTTAVGSHIRRDCSIEDGVIDRQVVLSVHVSGPHGEYLVRSVPVDRSRPELGYAGLEIDACPPKVFQGHNAWGGGDLRAYLEALVDIATEELDLDVPDDVRQRWRAGEVRLLRVDCTAMVPAAGYGDTDTLLKLIGQSCVSTHRPGGPAPYAHSLCFGQSSKRWQLKLYNKYSEMQERGSSRPEVQEAETWVKGMLRMELVLKRQEIVNRGVESASCWEGGTAQQLWETYRSKISVVAHRPILGDDPDGLKPSERRVLHLWKSGCSPEKEFCRQTFQKYRKKFKKTLGVDIKYPYAPQQHLDLENLIHIQPPATHPPIQIEASPEEDTVQARMVDQLTYSVVTTVREAALGIGEGSTGDESRENSIVAAAASANGNTRTPNRPQRRRRRRSRPEISARRRYAGASNRPPSPSDPPASPRSTRGTLPGRGRRMSRAPAATVACHDRLPRRQTRPRTRRCRHVASSAAAGRLRNLLADLPQVLIKCQKESNLSASRCFAKFPSKCLMQSNAGGATPLSWRRGLADREGQGASRRAGSSLPRTHARFPSSASLPYLLHLKQIPQYLCHLAPGGSLPWIPVRSQFYQTIQQAVVFSQQQILSVVRTDEGGAQLGRISGWDFLKLISECPGRPHDHGDRLTSRQQRGVFVPKRE